MMEIKIKKLIIKENKQQINKMQTKNKFQVQPILKVKDQIVLKKENLMLFLRI